jgi:anti-anti-sigma regulatory factor
LAHEDVVTPHPVAEESLRIAAQVRAQLRLQPGLAAEGAARVDALVDELVPFIESVARAEASPEVPSLWQEARSLVYLFAHRLADQGYTPLALSSALTVWRDASRRDLARPHADEVQALLLDGFARGREDATRSALQRHLGAHLPVARLVPGVVLAVAAGPLDAENARALADRAGTLLLRDEGRAAVLDLSGLDDPEPAVLAALWALVSSAQMLGAAVVTVGHAVLVRAALAEGTLHEAPHAVVDTLPEAVACALDLVGLRLAPAQTLRRWIQQALRGGRSPRPDGHPRPRGRR